VCGLSFVGSDVGGFVGDPEPELLVRWYQLGVFMPYFRGHSDKRCKRREPWLFPGKPFELVKESIKERYRLLAYFYTCFEEHSRTGVPLLRPTWLANEVIMDDETMKDEVRFMLGDSLLVEPILEPGKPILKDPLRGMSGRWYDYYTKKEVFPEEEVNVGIDRIGCFLKGGKIVPLFEVRSYMKSSKDVKEGNLTLYIGLDEQETATGNIYFDDGETFNYRNGNFMRKKIEFQKDKLVWENNGETGYVPHNRVTKVVLMGLNNTNFSKAYLQIEGGPKKAIQIIKNTDHVVLEFVALADKNWSINLE